MTNGQTFDRYQILRQLGGGSMGTVYLAVRQDIGQQVALKIVRGGESAEASERIAVESEGAELQQKLSSNGTHDPRVVAVHRIFRSGPNLAIEMEYVQGEDLYKILQRGRLDPERAGRIAVALCDMLANLSVSNPFVHGDLKPSNILITRDDQVKVIDFGIAKALEKSKVTTFNPYQSAAYSSPERLASNRVDANSDLWSIGVMLYEMVAGKRPFGNSDEDLRTRIQQGPEPLPDFVPLPLRRIIFQMLAAMPASRYANAAECANDLRRFLAGQAVSAPEPDQATRRTVPPTDSEATRRTTPPPAQPRPAGAAPAVPARVVPVRPKRRTAAYVVLGIFTTAVVAVLWFMNSQHQVSTDAAALEGRIASHQIAAGAAWPAYTDIASRCHVPFLIYGLTRSLKNSLIDSADEVISDYRRDQPTSERDDWTRAMQNLQHALELDPGNKSLTGRLDVCEGHLMRIKAHGPTKQKTLNAAIAKFEDAARLMPDSRDPYLGLARIYTYDMADSDKAAEMINEATKRGHTIGKREKAQMADALRSRGMRLQQESRQFGDMPDQERKYLEKAREDFRSAAQYYSELGDFTRGAPALYKDVLRRAQTIEDRMNEIR